METISHPSGLLLVDKPLEMTSFRAGQIAAKQLSRELGVKRVKVGHAGTLDPLASGLLVVAVGKATKQLADLVLLSKKYRATVLFGETTDTLDSEGVIVEEGSASDLGFSDIRNALLGMIGPHDYEVPLYSAVKVDGKPLYWYARNNKVPPRIPKKTMELLSAEIQEESWCDATLSKKELVIDMEVTKGTYIRTLAQALGAKLGIPSRLSGLRRTSVGAFDVSDAKSPEEVSVKDIRPL